MTKTPHGTTMGGFRFALLGSMHYDRTRSHILLETNDYLKDLGAVAGDGIPCG